MKHKRLLQEKRKMTNQKRTKDSHRLKTFFSGVSMLLTAIGLIIAIVLGINELIDRRIENDQFIRKVAAHIRPYVIFDENGSILVDGGAMQDLEKIEVESEVKEGENYPNLKIIVTPKHHLVYPPIIESLLPIMFDITDERGEGNKFIYQLVPGWNAIDPDKKVVLRFRLEILK